MSEKNYREELLLHMYNQTFNNINRHITVVWQTIGTLIGAFAFLALAEKHIISEDIAISLIIFVVAWAVAHLYDASSWYNRNIAIITNIERQLLNAKDEKEIHFFFLKHRKNEMIEHFKIQFCLSFGIGLIMLLYHFFKYVFPYIVFDIHSIDLLKYLPYITCCLATQRIYVLRKHYQQQYNDLIRNSPGKEIQLFGKASEKNDTSKEQTQ